jgi:hypothetical protein
VQLPLRIPSAEKKNDPIFFFKWPINYLNAKDDPYEAPILAYNREIDQLMEANTISSEVDEEDFATCPNGEMMESYDKKESMVLKTPCLENTMTDSKEEGMKSTTPRSKMGSNDVTNTPKKIGST